MAAEFLFAALPWIAGGLCIAVVFVLLDDRRKSRTH